MNPCAWIRELAKHSHQPWSWSLPRPPSCFCLRKTTHDPLSLGQGSASRPPSSRALLNYTHDWNTPLRSVQTVVACLSLSLRFNLSCCSPLAVQHRALTLRRTFYVYLRVQLQTFPQTIHQWFSPLSTVMPVSTSGFEASTKLSLHLHQ